MQVSFLCGSCTFGKFGKVKHVRVLFHAQLCTSDLMTCSRMLESQKGLGEEDSERKNISKHDDPV